MSGIIDKVKEEVRKILVVALFFSTGFCLIHVCTLLFSEGSDLQIASITKGLVGGFIVAKVLLMMDLLPFVNAFPSRPLVNNVVWKSSLYVAGGVIFLYIEPFLKNVFKGAGLYSAHLHAWEELMLPRTWATVIFLAMLMVVFVAFQELSRVIGKDRMKHMFFGQRHKPAAAKSFRDAA